MNLCCFLKLIGNKIFFYTKANKISCNLGKPHGYFQSVKRLNLIFQIWSEARSMVGSSLKHRFFTLQSKSMKYLEQSYW